MTVTPSSTRNTYILERLGRKATRYVGETADLRKCLDEHNVDANISTAREGPWKVSVYLKSASQCAASGRSERACGSNLRYEHGC